MANRKPAASTAVVSAARSTFGSSIRAHHRLLACGFVGVVTGVAWPGIETWLSRGLVAWNVLVWLYLAWVGIDIWRAPHGHVKQLAEAQTESAFTVLSVVLIAVVVAIVAVVFELQAAKVASSKHAAPHVAFAAITVAGCWLMLPILFGLNYAARYFAGSPNGGIDFPGPKGFEPQQGDFLYFSFTIAVAAQTADVAISSPQIRRLVTAHALVSFLFNTTVLAFAINAGSQFF